MTGRGGKTLLIGSDREQTYRLRFSLKEAMCGAQSSQNQQQCLSIPFLTRQNKAEQHGFPLQVKRVTWPQALLARREAVPMARCSRKRGIFMVDEATYKTVVITGSGKGIGRALALKLASLPYNLVLNYIADEASACEVLDCCERLTPRVRMVRADVARRAEAEHLIDTAYDVFGSVDALINNAGINIDKPLRDLTDEDWDRVVDTNMKGVFLCAQRASSYMLQQPQGGVILNIGATTAIRGRMNGLNYCASKAGVLTMTKCLALELAPYVRVNCLIPGFTSTREVEHRYHLADPEVLQEVKRKIPLHRIAAPAEIAEIAAFLLSDEARHITGQKIIVDGGEFMF